MSLSGFLNTVLGRAAYDKDTFQSTQATTPHPNVPPVVGSEAIRETARESPIQAYPYPQELSSTIETIQYEEEEEAYLKQQQDLYYKWGFGVIGAVVGVGIAAALTRKHVEPLTSAAYMTLSGLSAGTLSYAGPKYILPLASTHLGLQVPLQNEQQKQTTTST